MNAELNPCPLQKKPICLLTCLPTVSVKSGLVSSPGNKLQSMNNADTRHVGFCGSYYSDVFHRFSLVKNLNFCKALLNIVYSFSAI